MFPRRYNEQPSSSKTCPLCCCIVDNMQEHIQECCRSVYNCRKCNVPLSTGSKRKFHESNCIANEANHREALDGLFRITKFDLPPNQDHEFLINKQSQRITLVLQLLLTTALKFYIGVKVNMRRQINNVTDFIYFNTSSTILLKENNALEMVKEHLNKLVQKIDTYIRNGSGWSVVTVSEMSIMTTKYNPMGGSSYIELPKELKSRNCLLNIKNEDQQCIMWCILASKHHQSQDATRVTKYMPYKSELNLKGVSFPTPLNDIKKIENLNALAINVYGYEKEGFYPLYISDKNQDPIHLLLIGNEQTQHYVLIKSLDVLLRNRTKHGKTMKHCFRCLHGFLNNELLQSHLEICRVFKVQRTVMPTKPILKFESYRKMIKYPVYIAYDFESLLIPHEADNSNTQKTSYHQPIAYALKVESCYYPEWSREVEYYCGIDAAHHFVSRLDEIYKELQPILEMNKPIKIDDPEILNTVNCYLCQAPLDNDKAIDHCHYTGRALGMAHGKCNRERACPKRIPVVAHNSQNYDLHLVIRELCKTVEPSSIRIIPKTMEKYTSLMTEKFFFVDSVQHLNSSLDKLVNNLKKDGSDALEPIKKFVNTNYGGDVRLFNLLTSKLPYPYTFMDSPERFKEELPPIEAFFNDLTNSPCSNEDYNKVKKVFESFNLKTLGDLTKLYCITDVLLLTSVINQYREESHDNFQLDPLWYSTAPGFSFDACMKMTGVELTLLEDIDMYNFLEMGIRGGISVISQRHAEANNRYIKDVNDNENYLLYIDANNLYGWAMSEKLPISNFGWCQINEDEIRSYDTNSDIGYIVEVDLTVPKDLHNYFNDYPPAPEHLEIRDEMISPISAHIREKRKYKKCFKSTKLAPNLLNKEKYICHVRNLQLYLNLGMVLTKIHRCLSFKQKAWVKPYIEFNTCKRQQATNEFQKAFHKLLNNSFFGKTMESVRRRKNVVLINRESQHIFQTSKPGFKRFSIFSEKLVGVELVKPKIVLDRPIYAGATILDLSKLLMFEFFYKVLKPTFPGIRLVFTDTDSFLLDIPTDDLYRDMKGLAEHFDFSNYPTTHPLYSIENKAVLGKFKDETAGEPIEEFIGLRSKCYSIKLKNSSKSTAAGVKKSVAKHIDHEKYKETLVTQKDYFISQMLIRSTNHDIFTIKQNKVGLTSYDDKRYLLENETLAYGHYKIDLN